MEVFKVNSCTEDGIDLVSEKQMESLFERIKDSADIMIKWTETVPETDRLEAYEANRSKILLTESLMARIKDGRFSLTSTREVEEN